VQRTLSFCVYKTRKGVQKQMQLNSNAFTKTVVVGTVSVVGLTVLSWLPCGDVFSCLTLFMYVLIGAAYGYFARQQGAKPDLPTGAVWGGAAAAISSLIPILMMAFGGSDSFIVATLCSGFLFVFCGFFTFALGAVGGALYAVME
jgi:hypothetical protein